MINSIFNKWKQLIQQHSPQASVSCGLDAQGVHRSIIVNIHVRAQNGYYLEQACTKCTYKRHIVIKQEVDIHEAGDKAIEKYM
jgi:hypothetical protein